MKKELNITDAKGGAALTVQIVPKANKTEIAGILEDGTIKIRLMAPPVEDQTNDELIGFLSSLFGCAPSDVEVVAGLDGRRKLISVVNVATSTVEEVIRNSATGGE